MIEGLYATKHEAFEAGKALGMAKTITRQDRDRAARAVFDYCEDNVANLMRLPLRHQVGIAEAVILALQGVEP
jgi:hypothetical protein